MNGYELSRGWFDFAFENQSIVKPAHCAVYFWVIELANRMGWPKEFANPTSQAMAACGISSYNTYKKTFDELVEWKFINLIKPSANQYQSCIVALSKNNKALYKSLDKSLNNHLPDQLHITDSINKPQTTNKEKQQTIAFSDFWDAYGKKKGDKPGAERAWHKLKEPDRAAIMAGVQSYAAKFKGDKNQYQPYPKSFLNGRYWEEEDYGMKQPEKQNQVLHTLPTYTKEEYEKEFYGL